MSHTADQILQILDQCHGNEELEKSKRVLEEDSLEKIKSDVEGILKNVAYNMDYVDYASLNKILAVCNLAIDKEMDAIYHIVESESVFLRQQIIIRYLKTMTRQSIMNIPQDHDLESKYVGFKPSGNKSYDDLKSKIRELPKEWYILQISAQYQSLDEIQYGKLERRSMHAVHLTVFPTISDDVKPFTITLPKPRMQFPYDVSGEIKSILDSNKSDLEAAYVNNKVYWKMRERQNEKMRTAIKELESTWLREWRILFMADPVEDSRVTKDLLQMMDKLIVDYKDRRKINSRTRWFLRKIVLSAGYLTREELARAVTHVLKNHEKLAKNVILSVCSKHEQIKLSMSTKRKTLILIVDENMDYVSWESMEILKGHPVTRFSSLHVAYALFKEHEDTIRDGCKVIQNKHDLGTFIVNPSGNLPKMEKRIRILIENWLSSWKGIYNLPPEAEFLEEALLSSELLMYNGHGSGIQYLPGNQIEKLKVKAVVLLFGCNSVKLVFSGGRYPPYGVSNQYLIAKSPCILGMLWEVTDLDIDKMTAHFITNWISTAAEKSWSNIDVEMWSSGVLKFKDDQKPLDDTLREEKEMLRVIAKSKEACSQYMTSAAIVTRGLPISLQ